MFLVTQIGMLVCIMCKLKRYNNEKTALLLLLMVSSSLAAKSVQLTSPNGEIKLTINDDNSRPNYQIDFAQQKVIAPSQLGMEFKDAESLSDGFEIKEVLRNNVDSWWQLPWGERQHIQDKHNEVAITFTAKRDSANRYTVRFRAFDDGIGFRYEVPKQKGLLDHIEITKELTQFSLADAEQATAWWIPARGWNRYEYTYITTGLSDIDRVHTPFTYKLKSGVHLSIHEAALVDYAAMTLDQRRPGLFKADLTPWSDGVLVKTNADFKTPWRTIQISKDAVGLLNSNLILNLNEPNKLGDVSWVEPGKYVGIWWGMHVGENSWASGKKHGATTNETKRYMDFAAKYGFQGVLVEG